MPTTTEPTLGLLSLEAATALEALCFDDDDLCSMIADLGVLNAVVRMSENHDMVPPSREIRIEAAVHELRMKCISDRDKTAARWQQYLKEEPPF